MARKASYTTDELREQLRLGKNLQEIADHFRRNISNISRAVARLKEQDAAAAFEARPEHIDAEVDGDDEVEDVTDLVLAPQRPSSTSSTAPAAPAVSMWDVKAAAEQNYAFLEEMLDTGPRAKFYCDSKTRVRVLGERRAHLQLVVEVHKSIYSEQQFRTVIRIVKKLLKKVAPAICDEFIAELRQQLPLTGVADES